MKTVSLFTGIGGFDVGFRSSGIEAQMFAEVDPHASAVLQRHFPDVPNVGDIRRLKELPPNIDVLAAGFPCQDLSQELQRERSGLIAAVFRPPSGRRVPSATLDNVPLMRPRRDTRVNLRENERHQDRGRRTSCSRFGQPTNRLG